MDGRIILTEGKNLERFQMKLKALHDRYDELSPFVREFVDNMIESVKDQSWNPTTKQWNFLGQCWIDLANMR